MVSFRFSPKNYIAPEPLPLIRRSALTLARLAKMLGIIALIIGIIAFVLPGEFLFTDDIISLSSSFGSLLIPMLESKPLLAFFIQKSPAFLFIVLGLILILIGMIKGRK